MKTSRYFKQKMTKPVQSLLLMISLLIAPNAMAGWEVNFIDTFSGNGVNWSNWTAQIDANYNNEVQCYTDDESSDVKNFDVSDGTLKIIARKQQVQCAGLNNQSKSWTSGRINSKDKQEFLYGRIEARIRFHNLEGGTWPAFWMLENRIAESPRKNDNDFSHWPNPGAGEIDVWEWFANNPSTYITNFFNTGGASCGKEIRHSYPNGSSDVLDWHDYALEWDENNISFYMDDTLVVSHNVSNCPQYKEPMFVLLNVAMGGNLGGAIDAKLNEATLEIDYLAHCTATNSNNAKRCNENTPSVYADDDNDGIKNDHDQCPKTPAQEPVNINGCPLDSDEQCPNDPTVNCLPFIEDSDNDKVADDIDACPNTPEETNVDLVGCPLLFDEKEANVAPTVNLSINQKNSVISVIEKSDGIVEIIALGSDDNADDTLSYSWITGGELSSATISGAKVSFDPSSMAAGSTHTIKVTVSDSGDPILTASASIEVVISVAQKDISEEASDESSAGAFNYLIVFMLTLFYRKKFLVEKRHNNK